MRLSFNVSFIPTPSHTWVSQWGLVKEENPLGFRSSLDKLSSWARDLDFCLLPKSVKDNWFWGGLVRRVGDETNTSFWFDNWLGSSTLHSKYQRLFKLSVSPNDNISNFGSWVGEVWEWNIPWRRRLFIWEQDLCNSFLNDIKQVALHQFRSDNWEWKLDTSRQYSVKYAYKLLTTVDQTDLTNHHTPTLWKSLWKSKAPSKVIYLAWRLFHDRLPTKDALSKRGVLSLTNGDLFCSFCKDEPESSTHLFSSCSISYSACQLLYKWLRFNVVLPLNPILHYSNHLGLVSSSKCWKAWNSIWLAMVWAIWRHRNDIIFNNARRNINVILDNARVTVWLWFKSIMGKETTTYSEWIDKPIDCLTINV
ncbi:hypothetical protein Lal_00001305 [Lupinus albus]|nr:hypothetical protein Lal_00001305 [Lupinus albus]